MRCHPSSFARTVEECFTKEPCEQGFVKCLLNGFLDTTIYICRKKHIYIPFRVYILFNLFVLSVQHFCTQSTIFSY